MVENLPAYCHSPRTKPLDGFVFHFSAGGDFRKTADWAAAEDIGRSWDAIIGRKGETIIQNPQPKDRYTWHAGLSEWPHSDGETRSGANRYTLGIELANHGPLVRTKGRFWYEINGQMYRYKGPEHVHAVLRFDTGSVVESFWEPFTGAQMTSLKFLVRQWHERFQVPLRFAAHSDIAMPLGKKLDPGPCFDWSDFESMGERVGIRSSRLL